jgi:hypothetical protein
MAETMQMSGIIQQSPHGIKRAAADDLEREQRLTKRFNLLNLDQSGNRRYIPIAATSTSYKAPSYQSFPCSETTSNSYSDATSNSHSSPPVESDGMEVEDTPNRIYITDLDAEIASLEPSTPNHPIFLPDIEKHLLGLPAHVLKPSAEEEEARREKEKSMQLVVYGLPTSISIPEERDNVRRAIEDARRRVRERMPLGGQIEAAVKGTSTNWHGNWHGNRHDRNQPMSDDPDAMDVEL